MARAGHSSGPMEEYRLYTQWARAHSTAAHRENFQCSRWPVRWPYHQGLSQSAWRGRYSDQKYEIANLV